MRYISTRDSALDFTSAQAIVQGLSREGGLLLPQELPKLTLEDIQMLAKLPYAKRAAWVMKLFLADFTLEELEGYTELAYRPEKFDHPAVAPVTTLDEKTHILELWHGPTCAFKDMALQMLPYLLTASLEKTGEKRTVCILVATSGDTGKAALEGFCDVPGTKILVFFPRDGVSDIQKLQMITQSGENVGVCAVEGNFDDAQNGVKAIFSDPELREELSQRGYFLSSANSINWGRVLPQVVYYISAYCDLLQAGTLTLGDKINFCVPTGNFGNILAGWYAWQMGLPVGKMICASNENNVLTDFIQTGTYDRNRPFHTTTSPSMDILISSNLERLLYGLSRSDETVRGYMAALNAEGKYTVSQGIHQAVTDSFAAGWCDDRRTGGELAELFRQTGYLMDTHTAVAWSVLKDYRARTGDETPTVVVSTASPFKFCSSVLEAMGASKLLPGTAIIDQLAQATGIQAPEPLSSLAGKKVRFEACVEKTAMTSVVRELLR